MNDWMTASFLGRSTVSATAPRRVIGNEDDDGKTGRWEIARESEEKESNLLPPPHSQYQTGPAAAPLRD